MMRLYLFCLSIIFFSSQAGAAALDDCSSSTSSEDLPLSASRRRPLIPPEALWTVEQTQQWMTTVSRNKKTWPPFFKVLSSLPSASPYPVFSEGPFKYFPLPVVRGATLRGGAHTPYHITYAGLVCHAINSGALLAALKETPDKAFAPLIKQLESPPPSLEGSGK